jgi:NADH dehydrogenase (ubiquinone) 1 beta subcomplex subunit 10
MAVLSYFPQLYHGTDSTEIQQKKAEHIRESWVRTMEVRLVKDELNKCYRGEGVNAKQYCRELAERYALMLQENRVS